MTIFKVVFRQETIETFETYVEAPAEAEANNWAAKRRYSCSVLGTCVGTEYPVGSIISVDPASDVPEGAWINASTGADQDDI